MKKTPSYQWEVLENKILEQIEKIVSKSRKPGRPKKDVWKKEITVFKVKKALSVFNPPEELVDRLNNAGKQLNWRKLDEIARKFAKEYPDDCVWSDALLGVTMRFNSGSLPKYEKAEFEKWSSLDFCLYCWRMAPIRRGGVYICETHSNDKSAYIRAKRNLKAAQRKKRKIRAGINDMDSTYILNNEIDLTFPKWLPDLFPGLYDYLLDTVYRNADKNTQNELDKLINIKKIFEGMNYDVDQKTILNLIKYLDDKKDIDDLRKQTHIKIANTPTLLIEFLVSAEAWITLYSENITKKGGARKGSGRPKKNTSKVLH